MGSEDNNYEVKRLVPNKKQAQFLLNLASPHDTIHLYAGGAGAGKTQALVRGIVDCAVTLPGNRIAVARKVAKDLTDTIWEEFLKTVDPALIWDVRKQAKEIEMLTRDPRYRSVIWFRGLDERNRWGSTEFGQIFIEEANEVDLRDFLYLRTRLRHNLPKDANVVDSPYIKDEATRAMVRFIAMAMNPPEKIDHWLRQLWLESTIMGAKTKRTCVNTSTYDNAMNLPVEFIEILEQLPPGERERMLLGEPSLGIVGDACTPGWSAENIFGGPWPKEPMNWVRGWDFGWTHPACVWGQVVGGNVYIWAENFGSKIELRDFCRKHVMPMESHCHPDSTYKEYIDHQHASQHTDKSRETSKSILRDMGYRPFHKYSKPRDRAALINELLSKKRLFVHAANCPILVAALRGGWHREEDSDEPAKDGYYDHIADALGYLLWGEFGAKARKGSDVRDLGDDDITPNGLVRKARRMARLILPGMGR